MSSAIESFQSKPQPMVVASPEQVASILGAMRRVAETDGAMSASDSRALAAASTYIFAQTKPLDIRALPAVTPETLAASIQTAEMRQEAIKFATVMAFVDGKIDRTKIEKVLAYARALDVEGRYVTEIADAAEGHVQEALIDMTRANMESITGKAWADKDATAWLVPYGKTPDPELTARCKALASLSKESFGYAFYHHYASNNYAFPGEPAGLNGAFGFPHDTAHVVSGYDTTPRGELLVSTFTAAMHPHFPMAGHILPVIFSFQLDVQINPVAKASGGALDPVEFWHAYAGGQRTTMDTFAPGWDFWNYVHVPLRELRLQWHIPEAGLDRKRE